MEILPFTIHIAYIIYTSMSFFYHLGVPKVSGWNLIPAKVIIPAILLPQIGIHDTSSCQKGILGY